MGRGGLLPELWRCLQIIGISALVGLISGKLLLAVSLSLLGCLLWLFYNIYRLETWIHNARQLNHRNKDELRGVWQDIGYDVELMLSKHEKEKQRLNAVVHRVQEMAAALTDAVILIDTKGNMEWWNTAAEQMFNFREIDRGHKLTNLIRHPGFITYFDSRKYGSPLVLTLWRKEQQLEVQVHSFGEGERLVTARDITRLFKLEQMRKDFVANVSHELRTPLTVIRGYIETLADSPSAPPAWGKALQQMEQQAQRMTLLINDLITLTKLETDQKEETNHPVPIIPLLHTVIQDAKTISGEKKHTISLLDAEPFGIIGNQRELNSAFSNILINAINYSPENTTITLHCKRTSDGATVSIRDQGLGIDPKHIPRLTERFYRVDAGRSVAAGGTGLGLAIVKHVLLRHNAELRIESQVGKGSLFSCVFPESLIADIPPEQPSSNPTVK